ncbi:MAG: DUF2059 domain-containing protein [Thermosynechococcaceae cyanobacterium MS004]|nr:DUF2059 domain-containing protein [Thermosynechococcaceae cyanobacterium MS004]
MFKTKSKVLKFLVLSLIVCCTFLAVGVVNSQRLPFNKVQLISSTKETYKHKLASELLPEIGIAKRYDMHFDHLLGTLIGKGDDLKLYARFRKMFIREIGWQQFKDAYAKRLETDFSEDELKELLNLSKQPLMQKLLQSEFNAYEDTSKQRFRIGFELWENYNNGKIDLPLE